MGAVEAIYLLAACLWIGTVVGALWFGIRFALKARARRRRITRLVDAVLVPMGLGGRGAPARTVRRRVRR